MTRIDLSVRQANQTCAIGTLQLAWLVGNRHRSGLPSDGCFGHRLANHLPWQLGRFDQHAVASLLVSCTDEDEVEQKEQSRRQHDGSQAQLSLQEENFSAERMSRRTIVRYAQVNARRPDEETSRDVGNEEGIEDDQGYRSSCAQERYDKDD